MENNPSKHDPLLSFLDIPFIDPDSPATPSNKKRMEDR